MNAHEIGEKRPSAGGRGLPGEHPYGDRGQIVCLVVFLAVWGLDSFVFKGTTGLAASVPLSVRLAAACLVLLVSVLLVAKAHRVISGDAFGGRGLVTDGAFGMVRHPLYAGSLFFYLGIALSTLSLASLAAWCLTAVFYDIIARYEESLLLERYGEEYRQYRRRVPKWIPRILPARLGSE